MTLSSSITPSSTNPLFSKQAPLLKNSQSITPRINTMQIKGGNIHSQNQIGSHSSTIDYTSSTGTSNAFDNGKNNILGKYIVTTLNEGSSELCRKRRFNIGNEGSQQARVNSNYRNESLERILGDRASSYFD